MSTNFARNATVARGFAINRAHPDQNQKFHLKKDPPEKQENLKNFLIMNILFMFNHKWTALVLSLVRSRGIPPKDGLGFVSKIL